MLRKNTLCCLSLKYNTCPLFVEKGTEVFSNEKQCHSSEIKCTKPPNNRLSYICLKIQEEQDCFYISFDAKMVFPQIIAAFHALFDAIGLPGKLLVIITIVVETRFHVMRYVAIVKSPPLTYRGTISKCRMAVIALIWVIPIALSIDPFLGWGKPYVYNPEVFFCQHGWTVQSDLSG